MYLTLSSFKKFYSRIFFPLWPNHFVNEQIYENEVNKTKSIMCLLKLDHNLPNTAGPATPLTPMWTRVRE